MSGRGSTAVRALVVDDDAAVREVVRTMLESAGYEVVVAANGREALSALRSQPFRVLLTDLVMPELEGIETIRVIRRDYPDVKVIAMSGAFGGDYLRIAGYLGAHGTLAKPLQFAALLKMMSELLAGPGPPVAE